MLDAYIAFLLYDKLSERAVYNRRLTSMDRVEAGIKCTSVGKLPIHLPPDGLEAISH